MCCTPANSEKRRLLRLTLSGSACGYQAAGPNSCPAPPCPTAPGARTICIAVWGMLAERPVSAKPGRFLLKNAILAQSNEPRGGRVLAALCSAGAGTAAATTRLSALCEQPPAPSSTGPAGREASTHQAHTFGGLSRCSSAPHQRDQGNFVARFPINLARLSSAAPPVFAWLLCGTGRVLQAVSAAPSASRNNPTQPQNNNNNNKGGRRNRPRDHELQTYSALTAIQEKHKEAFGARAFPPATWDRSGLQPEECAGLPARRSASQSCLGRGAGGAAEPPQAPPAPSLPSA